MSLISLFPEDFAVGTLPIGDMEVLDARFEIFDYDGKVQFTQGNAPPVSLRLDVRTLADGVEHTDWITAGSSANITPTDDFMSLEGQNESIKSIFANTKLAWFINSLLDKGFPKAGLDKFKANSLIGLQFTAERPVSPESDLPTNTVRTDGKEKKDRQRTHLVVGAIIKLPPAIAKLAKGGRATPPAAPPARATGKPPAGSTAASKATMGTRPTKADEGSVNGHAASANGSGDLNERAAATMFTMLEKAEGNTIAVTGIRVKGFSALRQEDKETREEILAAICDEEWLVNNGFTVADGFVTT